MSKKFHVEKLCKELCQDKRVITLMIVGNKNKKRQWVAKPIYIRMLDYILKYNPCIGYMQLNDDKSNFYLENVQNALVHN